MINRIRMGYAKILMDDGSYIPGEGQQKGTYDPSGKWFPIYVEDSEGLGGMVQEVNTEQGTAGVQKPYVTTLLKEGFGNASGTIVKAMFSALRVKNAEIHLTKFNKQTGTDERYASVILDRGSFVKWNVAHEFGEQRRHLGPIPVPGKEDSATESLERIVIIAEVITWKGDAVDTKEDKRKGYEGHFDQTTGKTTKTA